MALDTTRKIAIAEAARKPSGGPAAPSSLDELEKLANLRQRGIITEDEFLAKKKQLLGLFTDPVKTMAYDQALSAPQYTPVIGPKASFGRSRVWLMAGGAALALVVVLNIYFGANERERKTEAQKVQRSNYSTTPEQQQLEVLASCRASAQRFRGLANYLEADIDVAIAECAKQGSNREEGRSSLPPSEARTVVVGTLADTVLEWRGQGLTSQVGRDEHGLLVEWRYPDSTYLMGRRLQGGIEAYRVVQITPSPSPAPSSDSAPASAPALSASTTTGTDTPVDCYALSKYAEAQGQNFFVRSAIVDNAKRKGLCIDK